MPDEGLEGLVLSVNQSITILEDELNETQDSLDKLNDRLTREYIPRNEAKEKADQLRKNALVVTVVLAGLGIVVFLFVLFIKAQALESCKDSREALRNVVTVAVADRQPLSTSSPETVEAIHQQNIDSIRPLRERLLALDGTQPEKC